MSGPEIHNYMKRTVKKWDLDRDVYLNTKVVGARWQEDSGLWKVIVTHEGGTREEYAEVLISGQGFLKCVAIPNPPALEKCRYFLLTGSTTECSLWKWPDIKGLDSFKGKKVHSADWDHSYNYTKKRIGVIGNGSSGIQIVPQLAGLEGTEVTSFQRGPTWVVSRMSAAMLLGRDDITPNPEYTEEDQRRFAVDPKYHNEYRRQLVHRINKAFRMVFILTLLV